MSEKIIGTVYVIANTAKNKKYIGLTRRPLAHRLQGHFDAAKKGIGGERSLWSAIRVDGKENFEIKVLERVSSLEELGARERYWINRLSTMVPEGYNQNRGGSVAKAPIKYIVDGIGFMGAAHLADEYGIYEETLRKRLHAGWTIEQAVGIKPPPSKRSRDGHKFIVGDRIYDSEREMCRFFKVPINRFRARYHQMSWTLEESLGLEERHSSTIKVGEIFYSTFEEACEAHQIPRERARGRLTRGWTTDEAFGVIPRINRGNLKQTKKRSESRFPMTIDGMVYESLKELSDKTKLKQKTLAYRIRMGWSDVELLSKEYSKSTGTEVTIGGHLFSSLSAACRHFKISNRVVQSRLRYGWSIEETFELVARKKKPMKIYSVQTPDSTIIETTNLSSFCREHGLRNVSNLWITLHATKHHFYKGYALIGEKEYSEE